jgi:L-aspartate oxidase
MSEEAGVERDAAGLANAAAVLAALDPASGSTLPGTAHEWEVLNIARAARAIVAAALAREESRGSHARSDFPATSQSFLGRLVVAGSAGPVFVPLGALATQEGSR